MRVSDEVRVALTDGRPVVALESTLLAHGLPANVSFAVAQELELAVRAAGAVPATIAILDGMPCVGLTPAELGRVCEQGRGLAKAAWRDVAWHCTQKSSAATTVSATAGLATRAGITVFATGGIGGVHRDGAQPSGDVSADLPALAQWPIAVVSAGAKAILDLPRTLETCETLSILVVGYQTDVFPAFYVRDSGLPLEHSVATAGELAALCRARWDLGGGGVLVANPVPEAYALPRAEIDAAISGAIAAAQQQKIIGKALTPFLLAELARTTDGRAVVTNRALALHNAHVGGALAAALAAIC